LAGLGIAAKTERERRSSPTICVPAECVFNIINMLPSPQIPRQAGSLRLPGQKSGPTRYISRGASSLLRTGFAFLRVAVVLCTDHCSCHSCQTQSRKIYQKPLGTVEMTMEYEPDHSTNTESLNGCRGRRSVMAVHSGLMAAITYSRRCLT
jgi:hypothetical protein